MWSWRWEVERGRPLRDKSVTLFSSLLMAVLATTQAQNRIDLLTNGLNGVLRINEKLPVAKADEEDIGVPVQASGVVRSVDLNGISLLKKYVVQRVEVIFFFFLKNQT